jgi:germination protein M
MRYGRLFFMGALAAALVAATGCGLLGAGNKANPSAPANTSSDHGDLAGGGGDTTSTAGPTRAMTLYFMDRNGYVVPMLEKIPATVGIAKEALSYMVSGGPGDALIKGTGLHGALPAGTVVNGVSIANGVATVDFSKNVLNYQTAKQGQGIVDAVVWTLTEFPDIKKVQLEVNGQILPTMPVSGTPVNEPISRDAGINLQIGGDVNPSDATRLVLYFEGSSEDDSFHYLVPVTREIPKSANQDPVRETMVQLASGPMATGLSATVAPDAKVANSSIQGDTAVVDFANSFADSSGLGKDTIESIVLSIAENAHVDKVQITVNGKAPALSADSGLDLSKPVMKPAYVNEEQL